MIERSAWVSALADPEARDLVRARLEHELSFWADPEDITWVSVPDGDAGYRLYASVEVPTQRGPSE